MKISVSAGIILLSIMMLILCVTDIMFGTVAIPFEKIIHTFQGTESNEAIRLIILESRLPKAITAILTGASLALAGLLMQTLFRNPLAGPYILGVSSGAGLGVAFLVMGGGLFGLTIVSSFSLAFASLLGSTFILIILFIVSLRLRDMMTLLILGVMLGAVATAIISLLQYFSVDSQLKSFLLWTMGSLNAVKGIELTIIASVLSAGFIGSMLMAKNMNMLNVGEEFAKSLGVAVNLNRFLMILISGALAGVVTAFCGPIGFIGIIIPHLSRLIFQTNNHLVIIPISVLLGADVLLFSDIISHLPSDGISLPINAITSIIGIPVILWILFSKRSLSRSF